MWQPILEFLTMTSNQLGSQSSWQQGSKLAAFWFINHSPLSHKDNTVQKLPIDILATFPEQDFDNNTR